MLNNKTFKGITILLLLTFILLLVLPDIAEARRGARSFGGFRSSSKSFGGYRSSQSSSLFKSKSGVSSFGGTRSSISSNYTTRYGVPRQKIQGSQMSGIPKNYIVNDYGNFSSGLMMGYLMGQAPLLWSLPFHPAFYYSKPHYVQNPDGTVDVYPPTFSFTKLLFTLIVVGAIIYVVVVIIRSRKRQALKPTPSRSSFE